MSTRMEGFSTSWGYPYLATGCLAFLVQAALSRPAEEHTDMLTFLPRAVFVQLLRQSLVLQAVDGFFTLRKLIQVVKSRSTDLPVYFLAALAKLAAFREVFVHARTQLSQRKVVQEKFLEAGFPEEKCTHFGESTLFHHIETFLFPLENFLMLKNRSDIIKVKNVSYLEPYSHQDKVESFHEQLRHILILSKSAQSLSIYCSRKNKAKMEEMSSIKCFLFVHGGGWMIGSSEIMHKDNLDVVLSEKGYVFVTIDYRLSPEASIHGMAEDVNTAIAWTKKNLPNVLAEILSEQFASKKVDIVISGNSAGGHLALLGTLGNYGKCENAYEELKGVDTSVIGCVDIYGVKDFCDNLGTKAVFDDGHFRRWIEAEVFGKSIDDHKEEAESYDPLSLLKAKEKESAAVPPVLIVHGTLDTLVPVAQAHVFFEELRNYRKASNQEDIKDVFIPLEDARHVFNLLANPLASAFSDAQLLFIDYCFSRV